MPEERNEQPSQKKIKKAKEKGFVAKSPFFASSTIFLLSILFINFTKNFFFNALSQSIKESFKYHYNLENVFKLVCKPIIFPLLFTLLTIWIVAFFAHLIQTGLVFFPNLLLRKKQGGEIKVFSPIIKILALITIGYFIFTNMFGHFEVYSSPKKELFFLYHELFHLIVIIAIVFFLLGLADFFYQKWRHYKKMHMTKAEKKQELKDNESNSKVKDYMRNKRG